MKDDLLQIRICGIRSQRQAARGGRLLGNGFPVGGSRHQGTSNEDMVFLESRRLKSRRSKAAAEGGKVNDAKSGNHRGEAEPRRFAVVTVQLASFVSGHRGMSLGIKRTEFSIQNIRG